MHSNQNLISTREVAERLGVDTTTVTRRVARGEIVPAVRAPGRRGAFLFAADAVEKLAADKVGAA